MTYLPLRLSPHIHPGYQRKSINLESLGQRSRSLQSTWVKWSKTVSDQLLKNALTYVPQTWSTHPWWQRNPIDLWAQGQRSNSPKPFQWISRECLDLPFSYMVHTSILGSRGHLLILGSLGQRSGWPLSNMQTTICLITISKNEFLLHTFMHLILDWLIQSTKYLWQKIQPGVDWVQYNFNHNLAHAKSSLIGW